MQKKLPLAKYLELLPKDTAEKVVAHVQARKLRIPDMEVKRVGNEPIKRQASDADKAMLKDGEMGVVHYVSTRDMDFDHEIMLPSGAILDAFKSWPQVYENHDLRKPPIGKDDWIEADEYGVKAKTVYAPTARGKDFWALRSNGFLNSSSIGFIPLESFGRKDKGWEKAAASCATWPEFADNASSVERITTQWLMVEHSDAWEPCNRHALTLAVAGKSLELSEEAIKELEIEDELRTLEEAEKANQGAASNKANEEKPPEPKPKPQPKQRIVRPVVKLIRGPTFVRLAPEWVAKEAARIARERIDLARGKI